jgi:hypothetical protein
LYARNLTAATRGVPTVDLAQVRRGSIRVQSPATVTLAGDWPTLLYASARASSLLAGVVLLVERDLGDPRRAIERNTGAAAGAVLHQVDVRSGVALPPPPMPLVGAVKPNRREHVISVL